MVNRWGSSQANATYAAPMACIVRCAVSLVDAVEVSASRAAIIRWASCSRARWLLVVLASVMLYSATLVVAGRGSGRLFDLLGFGMRDAGVVAGSTQEQHVLLIYGVLGSVLLGWSLTLLFIARGPLRQRDPWAWNTFTVAFSVWFLVDTTFSVAIGSLPHALFNGAFLLAVAPALIGMRGELACQ